MVVRGKRSRNRLEEYRRRRRSRRHVQVATAHHEGGDPAVQRVGISAEVRPLRSAAGKGLENGSSLRVEGDLPAAHVKRAAGGTVNSQGAVGVKQAFRGDSGERRINSGAHATEEETERNDNGDDCSSDAHKSASFHKTIQWFLKIRLSLHCLTCMRGSVAWCAFEQNGLLRYYKDDVLTRTNDTIGTYRDVNGVS